MTIQQTILTMQRTILLLCVFLPFLLQTGCGRGPQKPDGLPTLYPVTLQLEQDGKPLAGADVILRSDEIGTWSCGGVSDANGIVTVRTHGQFPGAPLGRHKVIVSKLKSNAALDTSQAKSLAEIKELEAKAVQEQARTNFGATTYLVERKFSNPATTPLEIEVVTGKNTFKLDVGPAVEIVEKRKSPL